MATSTLTIQIDDDLRERAEMYYNGKGLDLSKAICSLLYQSIAKTDLELDPPYTDQDIFYSKRNIQAIMDGIESCKKGRIIEKTMEELRAYEQ